jgi:hypothetical protein
MFLNSTGHTLLVLDYLDNEPKCYSDGIEVNFRWWTPQSPKYPEAARSIVRHVHQPSFSRRPLWAELAALFAHRRKSSRPSTGSSSAHQKG